MVRLVALSGDSPAIIGLENEARSVKKTPNAIRGRVFLSPPDMGDLEKTFLLQAFDSNWIAPLGPFVDQFEMQLSEILGGRPVVALSSGTSAIHLALIRLGVGRDDVVLVQSLTFCATANPVKYLGAEVVFVGSETATWNMCPDSLERAICETIARGKMPKAVIPVHLYGVPAKMSELSAIAEKYQIPIIEDAAESLGSTYWGRPTGSIGTFGILSFNGNKIVTTSGGGALVCPSVQEYDEVKHLATQAREVAPYYLHNKIGFNYRLSNICAALGVGQLQSLTTRVERRRALYRRYKAELGDLMDFSTDQDCNFENRWLSVAMLNRESRKKISAAGLVREMDARNIECRPLWKPLHTQPVFRDTLYFGNEVEIGLFENGVCLPSGSSLLDEEQGVVISSIRSIFFD